MSRRENRSCSRRFNTDINCAVWKLSTSSFLRSSLDVYLPRGKIIKLQLVSSVHLREANWSDPLFIRSRARHTQMYVRIHKHITLCMTRLRTIIMTDSHHINTFSYLSSSSTKSEGKINDDEADTMRVTKAIELFVVSFFVCRFIE